MMKKNKAVRTLRRRRNLTYVMATIFFVSAFARIIATPVGVADGICNVLATIVLMDAGAVSVYSALRTEKKIRKTISIRNRVRGWAFRVKLEECCAD